MTASPTAQLGPEGGGASLPTPELAAARHPTSGQLLIARIRFLTAMAVAGIIFWYFGWWVASPPDPGSAVALLMADQGVVTMAELLGLAVVVSGLAVAICGAGCADRGPLAIAVGLATLATRSGRMDMLVLYRLTSTTPGGGAEAAFPTFSFIAETWLWLALIGVGFVVGRWVDSWFSAVPEPKPIQTPSDPGADIRSGAGTVVVTFAIAWLLLSHFIGGGADNLEVGQIYFALGFSFMTGALVSQCLFRGRSRVWPLVVVALVASGAYLYAGPSAEELATAAKYGGYVTLEPLARPLPIEYAAMGAIGVLFEQDVMAMLGAMIGLSPEEERAAS